LKILVLLFTLSLPLGLLAQMNEVQKLDSIVYENWNESMQQWQSYQKRSFTYYPEGNVKTDIHYSFNNGEWMCSNGYDYSYDNEGRLKSKIVFTYCDSEKRLNIKDEWIYNESMNMNTKMGFVWSSETNDWNIKTQIEYNYDENGNDTLIFAEIFEYGNWQDYFKEEYSYDENGNVTSHIFYINESDYGFFEDHKNEMTYDENDKKISHLHYIGGSIWSKKEYSYNENNSVNLVTGFLWNHNSESWTTDNKVEINYDESGNISSKLLSTIAGIGWKQDAEYIYEYDLEFAIEDVISQSLNTIIPHLNYAAEIASYTVNKPLTFIQNRNEKSIGTCYYSSVDFTSNISVIESEELLLYPNPANDYIQLNSSFSFTNSARLEIRSASGSLVFSSISNYDKIDISDLVPGIYFVVVHDKYSFVLKFLKHY